jgi:hypothetical protein
MAVTHGGDAVLPSQRMASRQSPSWQTSHVPEGQSLHGTPLLTGAPGIAQFPGVPAALHWLVPRQSVAVPEQSVGVPSQPEPSQ